MPPDPQFYYSRRARLFLENLMEGEAAYENAPVVFEYLMKQNPKFGDAISRPPLVFYRVPVRIPKLKELAFYYHISRRKAQTEIVVFQIGFTDEVPTI